MTESMKDAPAETTASSGLAARLKTETQALHTEAEMQPFQQALLAGTLSRELYLRHLEQMLLLRRCLENCIRSARAEHGATLGFITDEQFREADVLDDLLTLGWKKRDIVPLGATAQLTDEIARTSQERPLALIGLHYVLEGSNNGGRFIAKSVRRAYGLSGRDGTKSLDPYGDAQTSNWAQFKQNLDALTLSPDDSDVVAAGAATMFRGVTLLAEAIMENPSETAL